LNLILLKGTLYDDPIPYKTKLGMFCLMNVGCRNVSKGKGLDWHKVVAYGRLAQACVDNLKKGMKVLLIGNLETKSWKDSKTKQWRKRVQVAVRSVTLDIHQWSSDYLDLALILAAQDSGQAEAELDADEDVDS
jgi:single-stranded DNA-binding protein